jgi:hypothetical protein
MKEAEARRQKRIAALLQNAPDELSPEEARDIAIENERLKREGEQRDRELSAAKEKLTADFVPYKIVNEEKLQHVIDELKRREIPFGEENFGLLVPESEIENVARIEKSFKPEEQKLSWRDELKLFIDRLVYKVDDFDGLLAELRRSGYIVRDKNRKYISVKPASGNFRAVRLKTLGDEYSEDALRDRISKKDDFLKNTERRLLTTDGLRAECLSSMRTVVVMIYDFSKQPRKLNPRRCYSIENDYHINLIAEQLKLLDRDGITDERDLERRISNIQKEIESLSEKLDAQNKTQANARDLIEKAEFYFANVGVKLESLDAMKFAAASDLLSRYNLRTPADLAKIRALLKNNAVKNIPALKEKIRDFSRKQDELLKVRRTLEKIRDKDFAASLRRPPQPAPVQPARPAETQTAQRKKETRR